MNHDDPTEAELATMRALHRESSARIDALPDPRVRAAVLAEATKAVTRDMNRTPGNPFGAGRWPLSMAAVLVVSVMAGLVATRTMRDEPERVAPLAVAASPSTSPSSEAAPTVATTIPAEAERSAPPMKASADRVASASIGDARTRAPHRPKVAQPAAALSHAEGPAGESASTSTRQSAAFAEGLDAAPSPAPAPAPTSAAAAAAPRQAPFADASLRRAVAQKASNEPPTPEAWVERIVSLRAAGQTGEAERELAALRLRHPDFAIPQAAIGPGGTR